MIYSEKCAVLIRNFSLGAPCEFQFLAFWLVQLTDRLEKLFGIKQVAEASLVVYAIAYGKSFKVNPPCCRQHSNEVINNLQQLLGERSHLLSSRHQWLCYNWTNSSEIMRRILRNILHYFTIKHSLAELQQILLFILQ